MFTTKITLAVLSLLVSQTVLTAQPIRFAVRVGGGSIVEDSHIGFSVAVDIKPIKVPITISPFVETFSGDDLSRRYLGLNLLITNSLAKSGFYVGGGIGSTRWSFAGFSRTASVFNILAGGRFLFGQKVGGFVEAKFIVNSKTDSDTDLFNQSSRNGFRDPVPAFLFDNDLVVNAGIFFKLF